LFILCVSGIAMIRPSSTSRVCLVVIARLHTAGAVSRMTDA
jgi:hypothetical protein